MKIALLVALAAASTTLHAQTGATTRPADPRAVEVGRYRLQPEKGQAEAQGEMILNGGTYFATRKSRRKEAFRMAKKSRGGRMTAAKKRAAKKPGGKGRVKRRKAGRKIMAT